MIQWIPAKRGIWQRPRVKAPKVFLWGFFSLANGGGGQPAAPMEPMRVGERSQGPKPVKHASLDLLHTLSVLSCDHCVGWCILL